MTPIRILFLVAVLGSTAVEGVASGAAPDAAAEYHDLIGRYCVTCHNQRTNVPAADPVRLDVATPDDPAADGAAWERVIRVLGVGSMPPPGASSPGEEKLADLRRWLAAARDRSAARPHAGRHVLHRLNRAEYANAIRDLLGLDVDVTAWLPSDGGDFGFDNIAAALKTSPLLLEGYVTAALRLSALAVGDTEAPPAATVYPISLEVTQSEHVEGLPLGTRGGLRVHHVFPADGEYVLSARLNRTLLEGYSGIEGHERPHEFVITVDGEQVFSAPVGGVRDQELNAEDLNKAATVLDRRLTRRIPLTAGPHDVGFTWIERRTIDQGVWQPSLRDTQEVHMAGGVPRLRAAVIEGPYNVTGPGSTPSRNRVFLCRPPSASQESACAEKIVTALAHRAFRGSANAGSLAAPIAFYRQARQDGGSFDAGIRAAVARILASPSFVFRAERDPEPVRAGAAHPVSDLELASRLSFFLWSSIPDDQLLRLAAAGQLRDPGVLASQVRRMVADERASALVANFAGQWLQLRSLESRVNADLLLFRDFDDNLRKAFRRETELLFTSILRENRSTLTLLDADYTFVNERLARHYGIPGVYGSRFRRVTVTDPRRRGLLGHGSILSLTSIASRTSPVMRGKYILSTFLNAPPPPPPPNVPQLETSARAGQPATARDLLERHRANPVCASCHRHIDPIGFALENFDPVGQWRDTTNDGVAIDAAGTFVDGRRIDGPIQLREALVHRVEVFVGTVTENLLIYALGRGLGPADMPVVRDIVRQAAKDDYRLMAIITGVVGSEPFQMRTTPPDTARRSSGPANQTNEEPRSP